MFHEQVGHFARQRVGRSGGAFGGVADFDARARAALGRNGIPWALSTTSGFADRDSDPLALPRIGIGPDPSLALFRLKVSGFNLRWVRLLAAKVAPRERVSVGTEAGASA